MTTRNARGRHAVLVRWRPDKNPEECTMDQIKSNPSEMMIEEDL
jgi:ATP-dependent DNA ligase